MNANVKIDPVKATAFLPDPRHAAQPPAWLVRSSQVFAQRVLPPLVILMAALLIWELLCSMEGAALPPPTQVVSDTWELITNPFYDNGGNDVGMAWRPPTLF